MNLQAGVRRCRREDQRPGLCQPGATPQEMTPTPFQSAEGAIHCGRRNGTDVRMVWCSASWSGLSALHWFCGRFPRALPWAGLGRAVGAGGREFGDEGGEEVGGGGAGGGELRFQRVHPGHPFAMLAIIRHGSVRGMRLLLSIAFLDRFEIEHETDDFHDLGAARPVQAVPMPLVIVLAEIGGQLVAIGRRG
jgi:hypothetical protein